MKWMRSYIMIGLLCLNITGCKVEEEMPVAATVNGEPIYEYQIEQVVNQLPEGEIDRDEVLEESIRQLVVIQTGREYGINMTDEEMDKLLLEYKGAYLDIYQQGIEIYGEEGLVNGLKYKTLYEKTKQYMLDHIIIPEIDMTDEELEQYLLDQEVGDIEINDETREIIEQSYMNNIAEENYNQEVEKLIDQAEITIH